MMPVESSVIKRNVVFHHQIICDHFQRFSESLKNIKRYSCWHELDFSCILRILLLHYLLILTLYNRIVCKKKKNYFVKLVPICFSCLKNGYRFYKIIFMTGIFVFCQLGLFHGNILLNNI